MPLPAATVKPLTERFQNQLLAIGERSSPKVRALWAGLGSYDEDQIATFARGAGPVLAAAKVAAVRHAVGYYSVAANVRPVPVNVDDVNVNPDMREPFIAAWSSLKNGASYDDAVEAGANRAEAVVRNLVTSSSRQTGDLVAEKAGLNVEGWERVPDGGACEWCLGVAESVYGTADATDFGHDRCGCSASPIYGDQPPSGEEPPALNAEQYGALKPGYWDLKRGQKVLDQLKQTPNGKLLADTLSKFQSGSARSIPLLRTNIAKRLAGETLDVKTKDRVDALLNSIRNSPTDFNPKTLYRGMRLDGSVDDVLAKYRAGGTLDLNLSSFTKDKKIADGFAQAPAGQRSLRTKTQTAVRIELAGGAGVRALPIEQIAKGNLFNKEKEWLTGGRFSVDSVTVAKDGTVVLKIRQNAVLGAR